jgi:hypothetical protein
MGTPFHHNVPSWMIRYLSHTQCSKCSTRIKKKDIVAIGIREYEKNSATLYIEHKCPECGFRSMKSFGERAQGTVEELCYMLLEELQNKRRVQQARGREGGIPATEMTDAEVQAFLDSLNKYENYTDLLKEIGAMEWLEPDES